MFCELMKIDGLAIGSWYMIGNGEMQSAVFDKKREKVKKSPNGGVSMLKKLLLPGIAAMLMLSAAGCDQTPGPEEQIHKILEDAVQKEKDFEQQQEPLVELEKKEKDLYGEIVSLSMKEFDKIVELSDEALENLDSRSEILEAERNSIVQSKEEFSKIGEPIKEIEEGKTKDLAEALKDTMEKRYKAHDELYNAYKSALEKDRELYELFKKEDLKMNDLEQQVKSINETYEKVMQANDAFNDATKKYNKEKKSFYSASGIEE